VNNEKQLHILQNVTEVMKKMHVGSNNSRLTIQVNSQRLIRLKIFLDPITDRV